MVIYLPGQANDDRPILDELTPREIVRELDRYVIGQADAKKAVAIALRNRIRRQLGPLWDALPEGALMHDPNAYLKRHEAARIAAE